MVFSSTVFTFLFLPVVLALYYLAKERYRNAILLAASIFFYAYGEPYFVFIMLASVLLNYLSALLVDRYRGSRKAAVLLAADIALNLGILFIFKYLDFSIRVIDSVFKRDLAPIGIALPIGISFFTFQAMSYVIDVYRGTAPVQKNPLNVALYISFFPQLIAGPIVRYNTIAKQIEERTCSVEKFGEGAKRFMTGFGKKVILANNLALVAEEAFRQTDFASGTLAYSWLGAKCSGSSSSKTSTIRIFRRLSRNSGADGICRWGSGSAIMSTSRWADPGRARERPSGICLLCGC